LMLATLVDEEIDPNAPIYLFRRTDGNGNTASRGNPRQRAVPQAPARTPRRTPAGRPTCRGRAESRKRKDPLIEYERGTWRGFDLQKRTKCYQFGEFPLQIAKRISSAFDSDEWLFEIKHDGFRVLPIRDGGSARLYTRNGYDISRRHQHITTAIAGLPAVR